MKKFFETILFPFTWAARLDLGNKLVKVFSKHKWLIYVCALLVTLLYIFLVYMLPTLL